MVTSKKLKLDEIQPSDIVIGQALYVEDSKGIKHLFFENETQAQEFANVKSGFEFQSHLIPKDKVDIVRNLLYNSLQKYELEKKTKDKDDSTSSLSKHTSINLLFLNNNQNIESTIFYSSELIDEEYLINEASIQKIFNRFADLMDDLRNLEGKILFERLKFRIYIQRLLLNEDIIKDDQQAFNIKREEINKSDQMKQ